MLKNFLDIAEAEVRSLISLYSEVVIPVNTFFPTFNLMFLLMGRLTWMMPYEDQAFVLMAPSITDTGIEKRDLTDKIRKSQKYKSD